MGQLQVQYMVLGMVLGGSPLRLFTAANSKPSTAHGMSKRMVKYFIRNIQQPMSEVLNFALVRHLEIERSILTLMMPETMYRRYNRTQILFWANVK